MAVSLSFHSHLSGQPDIHAPLHIPMVYESVPVTPVRWEYLVLAVNTREEELPDVAQLNDLGARGWLLVGMLEQKSGRESGPVYYYFVRPRAEEGEQ